MIFKIAEIPYLNCVPFYWNKEANSPADEKNGIQFTWIRASPKKLGELAKKGGIDAGPISLVDSFALEKQFEPLDNFGIAVKNAANSVLLFSKKPIRSLQGAQIGLTRDSVTSVQLLRFILERKYRLQANFHAGFRLSDDAQLKIGDEALKEILKNNSKKFNCAVDLGEEWKKWQGLPFVFARWMIRKNSPEIAKRLLYKILDRNLREQETAVERAAKNWKNFNAREYLEDFTYRLGKNETQSIRIFHNLLSR